jgi:hypothetical protein
MSTSLGLTSLGSQLVATFNAAGLATDGAARAALLWVVDQLAAISFMSGMMRGYQAQYDAISEHPKPPVSERVRDFYARWSVKFTAQYYEDRERDEATKGHAAA